MFICGKRATLTYHYFDIKIISADLSYSELRKADPYGEEAVMSTVIDTQDSHVRLETAEVFPLIVAAIDRAQEEGSPHTIFVHERDEQFGVAITIMPTSDALATYSDYLTALVLENPAITGPDEPNPEQDLWYRVLATRLGIEPLKANLVSGMSSSAHPFFYAIFPIGAHGFFNVYWVNTGRKYDKTYKIRSI